VTRLYVGNLNYNVTEDDLEAFFGQCGPLKDACVIVNKETGKARGFAFVEYVNPEDAATAIRSLDGVELLGRPVKLQEAVERKKSNA
jgi:RNA recognition motif-containing protein